MKTKLPKSFKNIRAFRFQNAFPKCPNKYVFPQMRSQTPKIRSQTTFLKSAPKNVLIKKCSQDAFPNAYTKKKTV